MIKILLFLASLEQKVAKTSSDANNAESADWTVKEYKHLKKSKEQLEKKMPEYPSLGERVKTAFTNTKNIARNAYDNSVGYVIAKNQNRQTTSYYKKNPADQKSIVYLMHGVAQNEGSQWRFGRELKNAGYTPYHLKGHHHLPRKENADKAFNQIGYLHKKTSLKEPYARKDIFSGHSSGADVGMYMAGDKRIAKYGIKHVQARAPVPYGIEPKTASQKIMGAIMDLKYDDIKKHREARESALEMDRIKPIVPVYVVSGKNDDLVPPKDAVYKPAKKHYVIDHKDSTHFGTSGVNNDMNKIFVDMIKQQDQKNKREKHYQVF